MNDFLQMLEMILQSGIRSIFRQNCDHCAGSRVPFTIFAVSLGVDIKAYIKEGVPNL